MAGEGAKEARQEGEINTAQTLSAQGGGGTGAQRAATEAAMRHKQLLAGSSGRMRQATAAQKAQLSSSASGSIAARQPQQSSRIYPPAANARPYHAGTWLLTTAGAAASRHADPGLLGRRLLLQRLPAAVLRRRALAKVGGHCGAQLVGAPAGLFGMGVGVGVRGVVEGEWGRSGGGGTLCVMQSSGTTTTMSAIASWRQTAQVRQAVCA